MTPFEQTLSEQAGPLTGRITRMLGDPALAEDVRQETLARAWGSAPRDLAPERLRAWLHRTATNLALDELRRRRRRGELPLEDAQAAAIAGGDTADGGDAAAALAALTPHQRLVLLLRFQAGLSLREVGELLDLSEDAARKRVARARAAFAEALAALRAGDERPTVVVLMGEDDPVPYRAWLERAGARVRFLGTDRPGLDLAGADGLVLSGSVADVHPRLYGQPRAPETVAPELHRDLRDLAALRIALRADLPVVGVCRGSQLLTVLFGGDLVQHLERHAGDRVHGVETARGSQARRILGARSEVVSDHHQAVGRLGRGLCVSAAAPDGTPEAIEVPGRRLAVGVQWHPERGGRAELLAAALVDAAQAARRRPAATA